MNDEKYDSRPETLKHIEAVRNRIDQMLGQLRARKFLHDLSKLEPPERAVFDEMTPLLKGCTYGSDEYRGFLARMKPALDHHYAENRHHPEHYECGVLSMTLIDLLEMLADWKAATERHADGCLVKSLRHNRTRFNIPTDLFRILCGTAHDLGWITEHDWVKLIDEEWRENNP